MPTLPPVLTWIILEVAFVAAGLSAWWAWSAARTHRMYTALREDLEDHLRQVAVAANRIVTASQRVHSEIERVFADPASQAGLERLEIVRSVLEKQQQYIERTLAAPMSASDLMTYAMPAVERSIGRMEDALLTILREWDSVLTLEAARQSSENGDLIAAARTESPEELKDARGENRALKETCKTLEKELEKLREDHDQLTFDHKKASTRVAELELAASQPRDATESTRAKEARIEDRVRREELEQQVERLRTNLFEAQEEVERLKEANEQKQQELDKLEPYIQTLEDQNRAQNEEIQRQTRELNAIESTRDNIQETQKTLREQLQDLLDE